MDLRASRIKAWEIDFEIQNYTFLAPVAFALSSFVLIQRCLRCDQFMREICASTYSNVIFHLSPPLMQCAAIRFICLLNKSQLARKSSRYDPVRAILEIRVELRHRELELSYEVEILRKISEVRWHEMLFFKQRMKKIRGRYFFSTAGYLLTVRSNIIAKYNIIIFIACTCTSKINYQNVGNYLPFFSSHSAITALKL